MAELKPCPFCGSKNAAPYSVKSCHSVLCVACGGEGPEADSEEEAIAAWNLRTPDTEEQRRALLAGEWDWSKVATKGEAHGTVSDAPGAWTCGRCGFRGFWSGGPHECAASTGGTYGR